MMVRGKTDINPILFKFGVALSFSLAGFLFSRLRTRRIKPFFTTLLSDHPSGGVGYQHEEDLHAIKIASSSCYCASDGHILDTEEICINKVIVDDSPTGLSPSSKHSGEDEFLLPEFNDVEKALDFGVTIIGNSIEKNSETPISRVESPKAYVIPQKDEYEREIQYLKTRISMLQERERNHEVQLLEYYGLREQETAAMEAQVADHTKVEAELEAAKAEVLLLHKKIRHVAEQKKEQIITLQQKVAKLQEQESKAAARDEGIQKKLQKLKDLESEAEELRKSNLRLHMDNFELVQRLDFTQILANSALEDSKLDALREESEHLRRENEGLMKEIERLQAGRCLDVEELVYLRWINACLRYELRNYQPPSGKTVARDLSKSLSPKSEKKAKQLIFEYANTDGIGEGGVGIMDYDSDQWSSSPASFLTYYGECDDYSSVGNSYATRTNTSSKVKFFHKLRRLLRRKDSHDCHKKSSNFPHFSSSVVTEDDAEDEGHGNEFATPTWTSRTSFDFQGTTDLQDRDGTNRDSTDMGKSKIFSHIRVASGDLKHRVCPLPHSLSTAKSELVKYAEALTESGCAKDKFHKRSVSYL